jgi:hypothetical protein
VTIVDANNITLGFASAPTNFRCVVFG